jgi:superfamily II DNA or RNA helicase
MLNPKVSEVQLAAFEAWKTKNCYGILAIATGVGKNFISFFAMAEEKKKSKVLFLAERTRREETLQVEISKYLHYYGIDLNKHVNLTFACYQTAYKWVDTEWDLVIGDEIHEVGEAYVQFFTNNKIHKFMGLSATTENNSTYTIQGVEMTKTKFLEQFIAPIVFTYTLSQAQEDGIARKAKIIIYSHELDKVNKSIKVTDSFWQTEQAAYDYWTQQIDDIKRKKGSKSSEFRRASMKRAEILYKLPSKAARVKQVLKELEGQTLVFANSIDLLKAITPFTVSYKEDADINKIIIEKFNKQEVSIMASFKLLQQGENLDHLDNCIIASYYSSTGPMLQRIGRLRRATQEGVIVFIVTKYTQEVIWINNMLKELKGYEVEVKN